MTPQFRQKTRVRPRLLHAISAPLLGGPQVRYTEVTHIAQNPNSRYERLVASDEKYRESAPSMGSRVWTPALRLEAVLMLKTQLRFLRFPWTFHRLFSGLWRVYKASRLLRIASLLAAVPLVL